MEIEPLFLTHKLKINSLSLKINVCDFQLKDHFLNTSNLYVLQCNCFGHKHNKERCTIITEPICSKCKKSTKLLITYQSLIFHKDVYRKKLTTCCEHTHTPPCNRCLNCNIGLKCIIPQDFTCNASTDVICHLNKNIFTKNLPFKNIIPHEHVYDIKLPSFYFCFIHKHFHKQNSRLECIIQTTKCCSNAVSVQDYNECFTVSVYSNDRRMKKLNEFIIFDPSIWKEQSYNHFMSFIRAVISNPEASMDRYKRFESSNFSISNIKKYKSGKESIIRTAITGFETQGLYQTSTISCIIPEYVVILPQNLYDILKSNNFDLNLVMVKRDPSILPTCMYVCAARRNEDSNIDVIIISDQQSKGFNQDQDGDKNAIYFVKTKIDGYDATKSYKYKVAKLEMAAAFRKRSTLISAPRYLFSETSLLIIERAKQELLNSYNGDFFKKTYKYGPTFMNQAISGYFQNEYDNFLKTLIDYNLNIDNLKFISTDDILLKTDRLSSIITSKAKGNKDLLDMLLINISSSKSLTDCKKPMIDLCNKYITSSQDLSKNGRKQFTALYSAHDLVSFNGNIYINKIFYANYTYFASTGLFLFNEASLELFINDLLAL